MKRYDLANWYMAPQYPYTPFRINNVETDIQNQAILPPIPVTVPGSIYDALVKAGIIEDPFFEMNSLKAQWVASHWWVYNTKITLHPTGKKMELVLEGIDYLGHVFFNGKKLKKEDNLCTPAVPTSKRIVAEDCLSPSSDNMYVPFVADVTDLVRDGENTVVVVLENAPDEVGQIGYTEETTTQKARFNYKWDWCTRLISIGLYRPAYIREYDTARLSDFYFKPVGTDGDAQLYATLQNDLPGCTLRVEIGDFKTEVPFKAGHEGFASRTFWKAKTALHVNDVRLWWPLDAGEQALYDLTLTILKDGAVLESETHKVGFRDFDLTENENASMDALHYVFTCNGKRIYAKGVNMTPNDMTCYNDPAKLRKLLTLMKEAHINLIRVWGGGVIEDELFYDLCDELGIMVWQEFIQSSSGINNTPSKYDIFLDRLHATATYATKTLRNHVSLSVWSGGNELFYPNWLPADFADRNLGMLLGIVKTYSPHVPMLPTSASGPNGGGRLDTPGDNHDIHGNWKYLGPVEHYTFFNKIDSLFHSEFGVDGMACLDTLKTFLSPENLKPTSMGANFVWRHHGEWWDTTWRDNHIFGEPKTIEEQIARSRFMQAEGLRYAIEANRRRAFENSGSIIWQINEPYPNVSCTSMIDYLLNPKPVFWQVGKAFAPLNVSLRYDKLVWEPGETVTAEVFVTLDGDEKKVSYTYGVGENSTSGEVVCGNTHAVSVGKIAVPAAGKFVDVKLSASAGTLTYENTIRLLVRQENGFCSDEGIAEIYPA